MPRVSPHAILVAIVALLLAACGTQTASPTEQARAEPTEEAAATEQATEQAEAEEGEAGSGGEGETVTLADFAFDPGELTISVGTEVTFVNEDTAPHTATHGTDGQAADDAAFDIDLPAGESGSHTFDEAGTFEVTCTIHPSMNMTITVEE